MDSFFQSLLRRYASGDHDNELAHRIVSTLLRKEGVEQMGKKEHRVIDAERPKSIEDIAHILTSEIIPLKIIEEWEDDHVVCGEAMFLAGDKLFRWSLWCCGAEIIGSFQFTRESHKAYNTAIEAILHSIWCSIDPEGIGDEHYGNLQQQPLNKEEIIHRFKNKEFPHGGEIFVHCMHFGSIWDKGRQFQEWGQKRFEQVYGPLVDRQGELNPDEHNSGWCRYATPRGIIITPQGSEWRYYDSRIDIETLPLDASPCAGLKMPADLEVGNSWPF